MICQKCGFNNENNSYFCSKCGERLLNNSNIDQSHMSSNPTQYVALTSNKNKKTATILCCIGFLWIIFFSVTSDFRYFLLILPVCGLHRFYVGKIWSGLFYYVTGGIFLVGTIVDLIKILLGQFSDNAGQPLRR